MADALTPRQAAFAAEYLVDLNATQAAIRAGYSVKTAKVIGAENLTKPAIFSIIQSGHAARLERTRISADSVLTELAKLGYSNILDYVTIDEAGQASVDLRNMTREQAAALTELTIEETTERDGKELKAVRRTKIKLADKRGALEAIGRHLGLFKEKLEISGPNGGAVLLEAVRERIAGKLGRLAPPDHASGDPQ